MAVGTKRTAPVVRDPGNVFERDVRAQVGALNKSPIVNGVLLTGVSLLTTSTPIAHTLGRPFKGFILVDAPVGCVLARDPAVTTDFDTFISLSSSFATTVSIWVF